MFYSPVPLASPGAVTLDGSDTIIQQMLEKKILFLHVYENADNMKRYTLVRKRERERENVGRLYSLVGWLVDFIVCQSLYYLRLFFLSNYMVSSNPI